MTRYDPRLLHDNPWRRIPEDPIDLPKGTIWAHRIDHSRGWPEHEAEYILDLRIRYPETKPLLDQLAAEQRQIDSELRRAYRTGRTGT